MSFLRAPQAKANPIARQGDRIAPEGSSAREEARAEEENLFEGRDRDRGGVRVLAPPGGPGAGAPLDAGRPPAGAGIDAGKPGGSGGGAPLDADIRTRFEPALRWSLADIRIHTDAQAARSAEALDAEAYTRGRDIVFNSGNYQPRSLAGQRLLAHELAHAVQQGGGPGSTPTGGVSRPGDRAEVEADSAAAALVAGRAAHLVPGSQPYGIYRQPKRADRFLPNEKDTLRKLGKGELDKLIDQIIADGKFHVIQQETIDGVEHIWEVKTLIVELSEQEQFQGASFGGAVAPETLAPSADGKTVRHELTYMLRGGRASTMTSALHELIHLRIMIDKSLPQAERSSFYSGYSEQAELTEVMPGASFKPDQNWDDKSIYGALPIVAGTMDKIKIVLKKMAAIRSLVISTDPDPKAPVAAALDADPTLTPAALIEFVTQEKYVTQTAAKATSSKGFAPSNDTVATRYANAVWGKFAGALPDAQQARLTSAAGSQKAEMLDGLRLALKNLYDAVDAAISQGQSALANPPATPQGKGTDPGIIENRPVDIGGKPIPLSP